MFVGGFSLNIPFKFDELVWRLCDGSALQSHKLKVIPFQRVNINSVVPMFRTHIPSAMTESDSTAHSHIAKKPMLTTDL